MTPDVNVLVAASRADHPHHAMARTWLEAAVQAAGAGAAFTLSGRGRPHHFGGNSFSSTMRSRETSM